MNSMATKTFINYCKAGVVGFRDVAPAAPIGRWQPVMFGPW